jgi:hypothetical protein
MEVATDKSIRRGEAVAVKLRALGMRGVLVQMAKRGQLIKLRCEMPTCYCPDGREHFVEAAAPMPDWAPNMDHHPRLKADGGTRIPENARLSHVLCNRADEGWRLRIRAMLRRGMSLEAIAEALNRKHVPPRRNETKWTASSVRWAYVS